MIGRPVRTYAVAAAFLLALLPLRLHAQATTVTQQDRYDAAAQDAKAEMLSDPREVVRKARKAEPLVAALASAKRRGAAEANLLWLQAEALYRLDDLDAAAPLAERAMKLANVWAVGSKLQADILLTHGSINGKMLHVADALRDFQTAHRLFKQLGNQRSEAISLICIATLYLDAKDYTSTLRYLDEALETYQADPGLAMSIFNTRGVAFQDQKLYSRANTDYQRALRYARQQHSVTIEGQFLRNIARNHLLAGDVAKADNAIAAARALGGGAIENNMQLNAVAAQAALQHGDLHKAERLVSKAFEGVDLSKTAFLFHAAHETAVATYRALKRPDLALMHLEALKRLDDEATKLATQTSTALMAAQFDSANQDAKISRLRLEENLQRAHTERMMFLGATGATAVVIVLLLIGVVTTRRSRDQVRAANADLAVTNHALGKALAAKTEFLATTSHEIRTPLNGILGMTQVMLADAALPEPIRERLGIVHGAGVTMRALVNDILDVAKMETGNLALEHAPFDLRACLRDAAILWEDQAHAKGLGFAVDLERCPQMVEGDAARVRQIVFNLLSNALKFTATGSVTISAQGTTGGVLIAVTDTGIGIAADKHDAVFESFRQADTSTTRQFGGTGLGLSICRNLVAAMDGSVTLDSVEGKGSTFTVALPLSPIAAVARSSDRSADGAALLVIDRNPITRAMFKSLLSPHATLAFAGSVEEAAACLAHGQVTHVLIDDGAAGQNGDAVQFVTDIVAAAGGAHTTLLWPATAVNTRHEMLALGVTRVIAKPISGAALVEALFSPVRDEPSTVALVSLAA